MGETQPPSPRDLGLSEKSKEPVPEAKDSAQQPIPEEPKTLSDDTSNKRKYRTAREYSRAEKPEERKALAAEIRGLRRERSQSVESLDQRIDGLLSEAESGKLEAGRAVEELRALEQRQLELKEGLISRVVHYAEIKRLEGELGVRRASVDKVVEHYETAKKSCS